MQRILFSTTTRLALLLSLAVCTSLPARAQEIPDLPPPGLKLPHVVLMSMGGTIASRGDTRLNITNYGGGGAMRVQPHEWLEDLPDVHQIARVTTDNVMRPEGSPPGSAISHWMTVARRIQEHVDNPEVDGVVLTHGTSAISNLSYFMNLVVDTKKPVVWVGAQRPWTGMSGDGPLNLYNAIRVAATPAAGGKGVLHATNQNIHASRDVMKMSAYRMETFQSVDLGVIGVADPDVVKFFSEPTRKHTYASEFKIKSLPEKLPAVEIVYAYPEAPGLLIDVMVENGAKGIIVDGTGAGSPAGGQNEAIKRAQAKGVVVVATARTRGGRVQETPRRTEAGIVPGDNFVPEKARTLLMLALTKTSDPKEIKRIFDEY
ncbi:asparaginase AnsZ [Opitutales bacterium ASA1]|uniref:asparaginase n=1 Tax=Congregicoccus parvus TaxID=3081749 RepID=UPI002B28D207|nr:asparaginase AnsZ [Opitutales bacterium ASA1]